MAVEQAVGVYVLSETLVESFVVIKDTILTKAGGYINSFQVLAEKSEDGIVTVKIQATVSVEPLVDQLGKLGLLKDWAIG